MILILKKIDFKKDYIQVIICLNYSVFWCFLKFCTQDEWLTSLTVVPGPVTHYSFISFLLFITKSIERAAHNMTFSQNCTSLSCSFLEFTQRVPAIKSLCFTLRRKRKYFIQNLREGSEDI